MWLTHHNVLTLMEVLPQPPLELQSQPLAVAKPIEVVKSLAILDSAGVAIGGEITEGRKHLCPHDSAEHDKHGD